MSEIEAIVMQISRKKDLNDLQREFAGLASKV